MVSLTISEINARVIILKRREGGRSREGNLELEYVNTLHAYKPEPAACCIIVNIQEVLDF